MNVERMREILDEVAGGESLLPVGRDLNVKQLLDDGVGLSGNPKGVQTIYVCLRWVVVNTDLAEKHRAELVSLLYQYPDLENLAKGPNYLGVGKILGSTDSALQLFAVGQVLGLWRVVVPEVFGFKGTEALQMGQGGLVMISGFRAAAPGAGS